MNAAELVSGAIDDLLNSSGKLKESLMKVKAIGYLIGNEELKNWVNNELDGYHGIKWGNVPRYREIPMSVRGNLVPRIGQGWQQNQLVATECLGEETHSLMTHQQLPHGVAELEHIVQKNEPFRIEIAPTQVRDMNKIIYPRSQWVLHSAWQLGMSASVEGVLSSIRLKLLDILMGIKVQFGDNIPLQSLQQKQAVNEIVNKSLHSIIAGPNSTVHVTVGDNNSQANSAGAGAQTNVTSGSNNAQSISTQQEVTSLQDLIAQIKQALADDPIFDSNREDINQEIERIETQLQKAEPKPGMLKRAFESLKELASDSAGTAAGHVVVELIKQAPALLVAAGLG